VSEVPGDIDYHHREASGRRELLALRKLRGDLEQLAPARGAHRRAHVAITGDRLAHELHELIAALDRRVPRVAQAGEPSIARDAAVLRAKAVKRLAEITGKDAPLRAASADPRVDSADAPSKT
jgi:hypothetical protein